MLESSTKQIVNSRHIRLSSHAPLLASAMQTSESIQAEIDNWALLLKKIAENRDKKAFATLFTHFAPKIKSYCLMLRSAQISNEIVEEIVQEVMLKVWLKAKYFNPQKSNANTWIFTIARNSRIDCLRKIQRTLTPLTADDLWPIPEEEEPYTSLHNRRIEKTILTAVNQLPDEQANVLKQIYLEGKSHSEVAKANNLPLGTVKSRVRLAIEKLKAVIHT